MSVQSYIDGTEVSDWVLEGSVTRRLNRPSQAQIRMPSQYAIGVVGDRLKIVINSELWFHGTILMIEDDCDEDTCYSVYSATDPWELWQWRPARDDSGNLIDPSFFNDYIMGPQIFEAVLLASENSALIPELAEGDLFLEYGIFEGSGVDLRGAPTNYPITIAELADTLTSTGEVDIVLTPIDTAGNMARVDVYNGDYGTDLSGSVTFDYATGEHNVRALRQAQDMSTMVNKLQYFFGPKETVTRFKANITGDDKCLEYPPGGNSRPTRPTTDNPLGDLISNSRSTYGVRMELQIFDVEEIYNEDQESISWTDPVTPCAYPDPFRFLYRRLWQLESWLRAQPRTLVHITPVRGVGIGDFDIGDIVSVSAGSIVRGGFTGAQRVYEYTVSWDEEGVLELSELQTSSDQEGS